MTKEKKENGWLKLLRIVVYTISITGVTVGASLIKTGRLSAAYADGTYAAKTNNGEVIFFVSLIILYINIMWGILRWFLRGYREKWRPGRTIGKLIGGGIWRTLVIIPLVLFSLFVISPGVSGVISKNVAEEMDNIENISLDIPQERLEYINEHLNENNFSEFKEELEELLLVNVDFGLDASQNVSAENIPNIFSDNAYAHGSGIKILNKAILSSEGNFIIFYTDTGEDAISSDNAEEMAGSLEDIVKGYKDNLGLDFEYKKFNSGSSSKRSNMGVVLENSGIDKDVLDTAMPVYVVNPFREENPLLAFYTRRHVANYDYKYINCSDGDSAKEDKCIFSKNIPSFPIITIIPSKLTDDDTVVTLAHELGHHYIDNYSYDNYDGWSSGDAFIQETGANWMTINVVQDLPKDNIISGNHHAKYLYRGTGIKIDEVLPGGLGYPAVAFLENYYEIVPDAKRKIMDATYFGDTYEYENGNDAFTDALHYLYNEAGEEYFEKVMISLAEKNLTGDYDGKLVNHYLPKGEKLQCADLCEKEYKINPAATEYLYFSVDEYYGVELNFFSLYLGVNASILGRDFDGKWQVLESGFEDFGGFRFTDEIMKKYDLIAFAVSNSNIEDDEIGEYEIDITSVEFEEIVEDVGEFDFSNIYKGLERGCSEINLEDLLDAFGQFMDFGGLLINEIVKMDGSGSYIDKQKEWDAETNEIKGKIEETKQAISGYEVSICANFVEKEYGFDEVKERLQRMAGTSLIKFEKKIDKYKVGVIFKYNLLTRYLKMYVLFEEEGHEKGLITVNVSEK